jgi:CRISPR-associated protein Csd1
LLLGIEAAVPSADTVAPTLAGDSGQAFALRLKSAIAGYRARLDPTDDIVIMGLDSATPGRMAITYYRELKGSEFLDRIERWHVQYAWPMNFGKDAKFIGAPAPRDIAEAAFGRRLDDKLRKATVERLLPCIVDGQPLPRDLVLLTARRAANRIGLEPWEWEKCLGIACALFRGYSQPQVKEYEMALEEGRTTRDYLYGRMLAIAEHIEGRALHIAGENRDTAAARLMQRFSDRPASTWKTIELALAPAKSRLRSSRGGFLWNMEKLLDDVASDFSSDDFTSDRPLSGEFLLGYHCQRHALRTNAPVVDDEQSTNE